MFDNEKMEIDSFQAMRAEVMEYEHNRNKTLIEEWCKESNVTTPVGYDNNNYKGIMTIYTSSPGSLIGMRGTRVDIFTKKLEKEFGKKYEVRFIEVAGGFVNI